MPVKKSDEILSCLPYLSSKYTLGVNFRTTSNITIFHLKSYHFTPPKITVHVFCIIIREGQFDPEIIKALHDSPYTSKSSTMDPDYGSAFTLISVISE